LNIEILLERQRHRVFEPQLASARPRSCPGCVAGMISESLISLRPCRYVCIACSTTVSGARGIDGDLLLREGRRAGRKGDSDGERSKALHVPQVPTVNR
jgi:hypothetical protein